MKTRQSKPRESEAALIIRSERASQIADEIARLSQIGAYRLEPKEPQRIHDILFDTPARDLRQQKYALRIRRVNGRNLITFKGASQKNKWGGRIRTEIELPWSPAAFARILSELKMRGISLAFSGDFARTSPVQTLQRAGLEIVQDRSTHRRIRHVLAKDESSKTVLAEMAIDSVDYHFEKQSVRIYEIEIESKENGARLGAVVSALSEMYKPALRPAESKLAIGSAIARLVDSGSLRKLIKPNNVLPLKQLDRIVRNLANA